MASTSLGVKRHCQSCGKNFYDLDKTPIVCPLCQTTFDPEVLLKSSRVKAAVQPIAKPEKAEADKEIDQDLVEGIDEDGAINDDEDMLDDDSDIAAIAPTEVNDDEEIEVSTDDDDLAGDLDDTEEDLDD